MKLLIPRQLVDLAQQVMAKGYTALKVVFVPYSEPLMGVPYVKRLRALMEKLQQPWATAWTS